MSVDRSLWVMSMVKRHIGIELTPEQANAYTRAVNFGPLPDWDAWQSVVRQFDQFKPAQGMGGRSSESATTQFEVGPDGVANPNVARRAAGMEAAEQVAVGPGHPERRSGHDRRGSTANEELKGSSYGYGRRTPVQVEHDEQLDARLTQINELMASAKEVQEQHDAKGAVAYAIALLQLDGALENKLLFESDRQRLATNLAERLNHMLRRND